MIYDGFVVERITKDGEIKKIGEVYKLPALTLRTSESDNYNLDMPTNQRTHPFCVRRA